MVMKDDEAVVIYVNGEFSASSDQDTERGRMLLEAFSENEFLKKLNLVPGFYSFNVVDNGVEKLTLLNSIEGSKHKVEFRSVSKNNSNSVSLTINQSDSSDWKNYRRFIGWCVLTLVLTAILLSINVR